MREKFSPELAADVVQKGHTLARSEVRAEVAAELL
jgi:hypothetical protein